MSSALAHLPIALILLPLAAAALTVPLDERRRNLKAAISVASTLGTIAMAVTLLVHRLVIDQRALEWLLAWTPFRAVEFATGMAAAAWTRRSNVNTPARADALFAAGALALLAIGWRWGRHDIAWWSATGARSRAWSRCRRRSRRCSAR